MGVFRPLLGNLPFLYLFIFLPSIPLDWHGNKRGIYNLTPLRQYILFLLVIKVSKYLLGQSIPGEIISK
jgi:hypothetical protein